VALRLMRKGGVGLLLGVLLAAPLLAAAWAGLGPADCAALFVAGLSTAVDLVGWVLVPQLALAVAVLGLALHSLAVRATGACAPHTPPWLDPAVESALLLGMLGTVSGMVGAFAGISLETLEPGPLLHNLGTALRSSLVGFSIALVGVWMKAAPAAGEAAA
jgi:hypothetical protein